MAALRLFLRIRRPLRLAGDLCDRTPVAKATGVPIAKIAARVMVGECLDGWKQPQNTGHVAVKEAVFPFARFPGVDPSSARK